jgi:hypothetical protein
VQAREDIFERDALQLSAAGQRFGERGHRRLDGFAPSADKRYRKRAR